MCPLLCPPHPRTARSRAEAQPYISLAATPTSPSTSPLAALALPLRLMNTGAAAVEAALGRRLYPITLDTFTRPAGAAGRRRVLGNTR